MALLALGINHQSAPVSVREQVALTGEHLKTALSTLRSVNSVSEAAIVSTCNRTEIYCGVQHTDTTSLQNWLTETWPMSGDEVFSHLYRHEDRAVVRHLMRVCSGLDSLVLGEPQILGQMKDAYRLADSHGTLGQELTQLFESAFRVAKRVRSDTDIGSSPVSVAFSAVTLARQLFSRLDEQKALLIGAGDTIQLAARHLRRAGIGDIAVANRTLARAQSLAQEVDGRAILLEDIPSALAEADIVISSTASPLPIIGKGTLQAAQQKRRYRPQLVVDIAVPRDVETAVSEIDGVFLYTVDDLQSVVDSGMRSRQKAAEKAEEIVDSSVDEYMRQMKVRSASHLITDYRDSVERVRGELLHKAMSQIDKGEDPHDVLRRFAHQFGNRLSHKPTRRLREAAEIGDQAMIEAARQLLDLR